MSFCRFNTLIIFEKNQKKWVEAQMLLAFLNVSILDEQNEASMFIVL